MAEDKSGNKLAIIGGGHIGLALTEGLINSGKTSGYQLIVANPSLAKIAHLKRQGVEITANNRHAAEKADWIFLAVKPIVVGQVLGEIKNLVKNKLVISLAAAVSWHKLKTIIKDSKVIRMMPNMAIACNQGAIGIFAREVSKDDKQQVRRLLSKLGLVIEVNREEKLNAVTLLSGCGPAIVSKLMTMLEGYGKDIGLSAEQSRKLIVQTFKGTSAYLGKKRMTPAELIESVATRGGISEAILLRLEKSGFQASLVEAMNFGLVKLVSCQIVVKSAVDLF